MNATTASEPAYRKIIQNNRFTIEQYDNLYLAYNPKIGAFSTLDEIELVAFYAFMEDQENFSGVLNWYKSATNNNNEYAEELTNKLVERLKREGWARNGF